jgi:hypothetical protein
LVPKLRLPKLGMNPRLLRHVLGGLLVLLLVFMAWRLMGPKDVVVALWFEDKGGGAALSREVQQSTLFALEYFNLARRGWGYRLRPLVVTGKDDREALEAIRGANASAVICGATSGFVARILPLLNQAKVPAIATNANAPSLAVEGDVLYRYSGPSGALEAGELARDLGGFQRYLAVIDGSNSVYSRGQLEGFAKGLGRDPVRVMEGDPGVMFERFRKELMVGDYDGLYLALPAYYTGIYLNMAWSLRDMGAVTSGWGVSSVSAALAGPNGTAWSVVFSPVELDMGHPFLRFLKGRIAGLPVLPALDSAYGAVSMLADALSSGGPGPQGVLRGLQGLRTVRALRGDYPLDAAGDAMLPLHRVILEDGVWRDRGVAGR